MLYILDLSVLYMLVVLSEKFGDFQNILILIISILSIAILVKCEIKSRGTDINNVIKGLFVFHFIVSIILILSELILDFETLNDSAKTMVLLIFLNTFLLAFTAIFEVEEK